MNLSPPAYSPSSLSPSLLTKTSAACQGCKLLTPPFLVSKQVILFSIPVSAETVIICPLKRSHAFRRNAGKSCQRNCWGWFGRENYKWPFTTNTEPAAAASEHCSISPSSKIIGGSYTEAYWFEKCILLSDRGKCNYRLAELIIRDVSLVKVRCVHWITASGRAEERGGVGAWNVRSSGVSSRTQTLPAPLTDHKHTHPHISPTPQQQPPPRSILPSTSHRGSGLAVTDLFLPFEERKTLPGRPQIYAQLHSAHKLAWAETQQLTAHSGFCSACRRQYFVILWKEAAVAVRSAFLKHYHKGIWCLNSQMDLFTLLKGKTVLCCHLHWLQRRKRCFSFVETRVKETGREQWRCHTLSVGIFCSSADDCTVTLARGGCSVSRWINYYNCSSVFSIGYMLIN